MSDFLKDIAKVAVGQQMQSWQNETLIAVNKAAQSRTSMVNQITAMKTNSDYTSEDITAAQSLIDFIDNQVKEMVKNI